MRNISSAVITGPTGAIGCALCKNLLSYGIKVYAVCRPDSKRIKNIPDGAVVIKCELNQLSTLKLKILENIDVFFHFAWSDTIGNGRNDMYSQVDNIKYTLDAINVASQLNCKVFIGAGSQAEFGRVDGIIHSNTPCKPENGYGMAKLCAGQMGKIESQKLGMEFIWTRILSVYGPNDSTKTMISTVIDSLLKSKKPSLTNGEQLWDYIFSYDAAEAFKKISEKGINGKTYIIASGISYPLKDYVKIIRDKINPKLELGFGDIICNNLISLSADISELENDTGFKPKTNFEEGIDKTISTLLISDSIK